MDKIVDQFETVAAVIPCYNEERNICLVVREARKYADQVFVVNDHSTDNTEPEARKAGAVVISNTSAFRGVGITTKLGIEAALKAGASIIVTLDGDGQHDPAEIPFLVNQMHKETADIIVGTRKLRWKNMPGYRRFGNDIISFTFNVGISSKISDSMSGFRAYSRRILTNIDLTENGFEYVPEILLKARYMAARIAEVPISCVYHSNFAMNSSMRPIEHGLRMLYTILKWRLALVGSGRPSLEVPAQPSNSYGTLEAIPEFKKANLR